VTAVNTVFVNASFGESAAQDPARGAGVAALSCGREDVASLVLPPHAVSVAVVAASIVAASAADRELDIWGFPDGLVDWNRFWDFGFVVFGWVCFCCQATFGSLLAGWFAGALAFVCLRFF
jgi:hypothetical protein